MSVLFDYQHKISFCVLQVKDCGLKHDVCCSFILPSGWKLQHVFSSLVCRPSRLARSLCFPLVQRDDLPSPFCSSRSRVFGSPWAALQSVKHKTLNPTSPPFCPWGRSLFVAGLPPGRRCRDVFLSYLLFCLRSHTMSILWLASINPGLKKWKMKGCVEYRLLRCEVSASVTGLVSGSIFLLCLHPF